MPPRRSIHETSSFESLRCWKSLLDETRARCRHMTSETVAAGCLGPRPSFPSEFHRSTRPATLGVRPRQAMGPVLEQRSSPMRTLEGMTRSEVEHSQSCHPTTRGEGLPEDGEYK